MQVIPSLVLKQLYTFGSLQNNEHRVAFSVKNRLSDATLTAVSRVKLDGGDIPLAAVTAAYVVAAAFLFTLANVCWYFLGTKLDEEKSTFESRAAERAATLLKKATKVYK